MRQHIFKLISACVSFFGAQVVQGQSIIGSLPTMPCDLLSRHTELREYPESARDQSFAKEVYSGTDSPKRYFAYLDVEEEDITERYIVIYQPHPTTVMLTEAAFAKLQEQLRVPNLSPAVSFEEALSQTSNKGFFMTHSVKSSNGGIVGRLWSVDQSTGSYVANFPTRSLTYNGSWFRTTLGGVPMNNYALSMFQANGDPQRTLNGISDPSPLSVFPGLAAGPFNLNDNYDFVVRVSNGAGQERVKTWVEFTYEKCVPSYSIKYSTAVQQTGSHYPEPELYRIMYEPTTGNLLGFDITEQQADYLKFGVEFLAGFVPGANSVCAYYQCRNGEASCYYLALAIGSDIADIVTFGASKLSKLDNLLDVPISAIDEVTKVRMLEGSIRIEKIRASADMINVATYLGYSSMTAATLYDDPNLASGTMMLPQLANTVYFSRNLRISTRKAFMLRGREEEAQRIGAAIQARIAVEAAASKQPKFRTTCTNCDELARAKKEVLEGPAKATQVCDAAVPKIKEPSDSMVGHGNLSSTVWNARLLIQQMHRDFDMGNVRKWPPILVDEQNYEAVIEGMYASNPHLKFQLKRFIQSGASDDLKVFIDSFNSVVNSLRGDRPYNFFGDLLGPTCNTMCSLNMTTPGALSLALSRGDCRGNFVAVGVLVQAFRKEMKESGRFIRDLRYRVSNRDFKPQVDTSHPDWPSTLAKFKEQNQELVQRLQSEGQDVTEFIQNFLVENYSGDHTVGFFFLGERTFTIDNLGWVNGDGVTGNGLLKKVEFPGGTIDLPMHYSAEQLEFPRMVEQIVRDE